MVAPLAAQFDPQSVFARLDALGRKQQLGQCVRGCAALLTIGLAGPICVGWLDYAGHLPPFGRAIGLVIWLLVLVGIFSRWIRRPLTQTPNRLQLALQVERAHPELNDALASLVHLEEQPNGAVGLRHALTRRAVKQSEDLELSTLARTPGLLKWCGLSVGLAIFALALLLARPTTTLTAVLRFVDPYGATAWPTQTYVTLTQPNPLPARLPRGEAITIAAQLTGVIPERAFLSLWPDDGSPLEQSYPVTSDPTGGQLLVVLESTKVQRGFRFRVRANDADSDWQRVDVRPAPQLVPLDGKPSPQLRLDFPAYTGVPTKTLPPGASLIDAVAGTTVTLRAATNRPITHASLVYRPEFPRFTGVAGLAALNASHSLGALAAHASGASVWAPIPVQITQQRQLRVDFVPRVSGLYALRFADADDVAGTRLLDVRVRPDPAPAVVLERPNANQDSLTVLPTAEITLHARIDDPVFAIRSVALEYHLGRAETPRRILLTTPEQLTPILQATARWLPGVLPSVSALAPPPQPRPTLVRVEQRLSLTQLRHADGQPLRAGDLVTVQMVADDYDEVWLDKPPGRSHEVELRIVSPAGLEQQLQSAQAKMRQELLAVREQQRAALQKAADAERQQQATGQLRPQDVANLDLAEQQQQQIRAKIGTTPQEGLRAEAAKLQQALRDNQQPTNTTTDRAEALATELERLHRETLEPLDGLLAAARKATPTESGKKPLTEAVKQQQQSEQSLTALLERLEPWSGAAEVRGETRALLQDQKKLAEQANKLGEQVPRGQAPEELSAQNRAELEKAGTQQERLAERADALIRKMERLAEQKATEAQKRTQQANQLERQADELAKANQPTEAAQRRSEAQDARGAAETLQQEATAMRAALENVRQDELKRGLGQAAQQLKQNELGPAGEQQQQATQTLEKVLDTLEERRGDDLDRLAKKLKAAEDKLKQITDEQDLLQKKTEAARAQPDTPERQAELDRLSKQQDQLQEQTRELAQQLSRLKADNAGQDLARASRQMTDAGRQLERNEPAEETQDDVLDRLDQAQKQVQQAREQIEEELMREKLTRAAHRLRALRDRQASLNTEGNRLLAAVQPGQPFGRAQLASLSQLADSQAGLAGETERLAELRFRTDFVFQRLLQQAAAAMTAASTHLTARQEAAQDDPDDTSADESVRVAQATALRRLDQLLAAVEPDPQLAKKSAPAAGGGGAPMGGSARPSDALPPQAELKALRALQAEINDRTTALNTEHPDPAQWSPTVKSEWQNLQQAQKDVAALLQKFLGEN
jgi:hypothetical protein